MTKNTHIVIMAGGVGSRFWPLSTPEYPKQFIDVLGCGRTLIQLTVDRFAGICPAENFWVVTNAAYVDIVKAQLPSIPADHILAEPAARNTAPCIAWACWRIKEEDPSANVVVTPSDAVVMNPEEFRRVIGNALDFTASRDAIVTVGIRPSRPETGYGYVEAGEAVAGEICSVAAFKEKPDAPTAQTYLEAGRYLWNAGIFVWNIRTIVDALRRYKPGIAADMDRMMETGDVQGIFPQCEKISIDYAVMEKADYIYTCPSDFGWSDVGTWGSLWTLKERDENGNAVVGDDVRLFDCKNCIIHTPDLKKVVIQGLEDCIVSKHGDRLLISRKDHEQQITDYSKD